MLDKVLFYLFSGIALIGALALITRRTGTHASICFSVVALAIAGIFLELHSTVLIVAQLCVVGFAVGFYRQWKVWFRPDSDFSCAGQLLTSIFGVVAVLLPLIGISVFGRKLQGHGILLFASPRVASEQPTISATVHAILNSYALSFGVVLVLLFVTFLGVFAIGKRAA